MAREASNADGPRMSYPEDVIADDWFPRPDQEYRVAAPLRSVAHSEGQARQRDAGLKRPGGTRR